MLSFCFWNVTTRCTLQSRLETLPSMECLESRALSFWVGPLDGTENTENTLFTFAAFCDVRSASQEDVFQLFGTNVAEACLSGSAPQGTLFEVDFPMCCFAWCYMQVQWKHLCIWSDWKWEDLHNAGCCGSGLKALSQISKMHATTHLSERARFWSDAFLTLKESVQSMHHEDKRCGSPATQYLQFLCESAVDSNLPRGAWCAGYWTSSSQKSDLHSDLFLTKLMRTSAHRRNWSNITKRV